MTAGNFLQFIVAGQIREEYIFDRTGKAKPPILGGSLLYSAVATHHWGGNTGCLGVVGNNFDPSKLNRLEKKGLDFRGVKVLPQPLAVKDVYAFRGDSNPLRENPVAIFSSYHHPLPRELLSPDEVMDSHDANQTTENPFFTLDDIPTDYLEATCGHICPLEISSQIQLSTLMQKGSLRMLTIQPHSATMIPAKFDEISILAKDCMGFITSELEIRSLFQARTVDLWSMMETIAGFGAQTVVIKNQTTGYSMLDRLANKKYWIPEYPLEKIDPTGEMDVFCGAFLARFQATYDSLDAVTMACAAASIKCEGSGPLSIETSLPGLDFARKQVLADQVIQI